MIYPKFCAFLLLGFTLVAESYATGDWNTDDAGIVLDGYDVVAYRIADRAVVGSPKFQSTFDGATFHFMSAANKALFDGDPVKYAPAYNGYCAFAMGKKNAKVPANPATYKLHNGRLLVFFNDLHDGTRFNTKLPWNDNEQNLRRQADRNWAAMQ